MTHRYSLSYTEADSIMRDTSRPMADRVLACLYMFQKAADESNAPNLGPFSAADIADYMGIEPIEIVEGAFVGLEGKGLIRNEGKPGLENDG